MSRIENKVIDTPTKGRFRLRHRNEMYFAGSDKPNEIGGMYAFWTALIHDPKPWTKRPHAVDVCPARSRVGLAPKKRFERMRLDALTQPLHRNYYRALYKSLKKPLKIRRATFGQITWWLDNHPELARLAVCPEYRKHGVKVPH